ncbi:MAG: ATP-dependent sacrificial sulfur transferase LarE [candidate division NC10 bacterium]
MNSNGIPDTIPLTWVTVVPALDVKIAKLQDLLREMGRVVVCFSGGVDSSFLLAESVRTLGEGAAALTAVSPSLAPDEKMAAQRLAEQLGARHLLVETHELDDPRYAGNPVNRCYFCKTELYGTAIEQARRLGIPHVLDGFNVDDRGDHRPGRKAAREYGVRSPLDELGFTKADIREAARRIDLPVWDKPALACLSSRFPYGTEITPDRLTQVARCERVLRELGFRVYRVRYHETVARIEVAQEEVDRLFVPKVRDEIVRRFRAAGFVHVAVDLQGYRTGSLNEAAWATGGKLKVLTLRGNGEGKEGQS